MELIEALTQVVLGLGGVLLIVCVALILGGDL
jgi:hypothetical protein